jgi:hypothetical protein
MERSDHARSSQPDESYSKIPTESENRYSTARIAEKILVETSRAFSASDPMSSFRHYMKANDALRNLTSDPLREPVEKELANLAGNQSLMKQLKMGAEVVRDASGQVTGIDFVSKKEHPISMKQVKQLENEGYSPSRSRQMLECDGWIKSIKAHLDTCPFLEEIDY